MGSSTRRYLTSTALMFALWQLGAMKLGREILLPAPLAVLRRAWQIAGAPIFLSTVVITLLRFLIGFLIAFLLAFMLGVLSGRYLMVYEYLAPFVQLVRAVPTVSIILLVLIWLRSQLAPILVGGLMAFPILYFNVVEGIRSVDGKLLEMAKVFCLSPGRVFSRIYLPSLTNYVMAGLASAAGLGLKMVIAAEVFAQPKAGIGTQFQVARQSLDTPALFAWAAIVVLLCALVDGLLKLVKIQNPARHNG